MNLIRILVADEQPDSRYALRQLLKAERDFQVIGEASDAATAVRLGRRIKPDILLLDLPLTRQKELQTLGGLASYLSPTRIVVMVTVIETAQIIEAFRLQAHGIVLKTSAPRAWFTSIRSVIACNYCIGGQSVAVLAEAFHDFLKQENGAIPPKDYGLTPREMEILAQIVAGRSNRQAGQEFSIGERTVKHHLTHIFSKIGVSNRVELALFAVHNRLLQAPALVSEAIAVLEEACAPT
jgi:DNA-binding NarL/FixJ family response regulator